MHKVGGRDVASLTLFLEAASRIHCNAKELMLFELNGACENKDQTRHIIVKANCVAICHEV